jgi:hypothetical protein
LYKHILVLINASLRAGKGGQEAELTGRSPLRTRWSAMDCSAMEEEEGKKEEKEERRRKEEKENEKKEEEKKKNEDEEKTEEEKEGKEKGEA